jgi:hypothetical protein
LFELIIGKTKTYKTSHIKEILPELKTPVIILDFKKEYNDLEGAITFDLGEINPFTEPMDFQDAIAINAATLEFSRYIEKRAEEVLKDVTKNDSKWDEYKHHRLIYESLDRSLNCWNQNENSYALEIRKYLYFNKSKQIHTLNDVLDKIISNDLIVLQSNGLHSTESRIILFLLLSSIQRKNHHFTLISDNLNLIWKDGHLTNFLRVFDFSKIDSIFSFNKTSNIPNNFLPLIDQYKIFRLDSNNDYTFLKKNGLNVSTTTKNAKSGVFQTLNVNKPVSI